MNHLMHVMLLLFAAGTLAAQRYDGNGRLSTQLRTTEPFHTVRIETWCEVELVCGRMPRVEVTTDENLQSRVKVRVADQVLTIEADGYLEPSRLTLSVGAPYITALSTSAHGSIRIAGLRAETFTLHAPVGTLRLEGAVQTLLLHTGSGDVDASRLEAQEVRISQQGWGHTAVQAAARLTVDAERGEIEYTGSPEIRWERQGAQLRQAGAPAAAVQTVQVRLRNNRLHSSVFYIAGPPERAFSYGFDLGPMGVREETVPAGTVVYQGASRSGRLLLAVRAEDAGKTLDLFP